MKLKIVFAFILIFQTIGIQANNWQQQYMADEFGDADYSRPVYELMVTPPRWIWCDCYVQLYSRAFYRKLYRCLYNTR